MDWLTLHEFSSFNLCCNIGQADELYYWKQVWFDRDSEGWFFMLLITNALFKFQHLNLINFACHKKHKNLYFDVA